MVSTQILAKKALYTSSDAHVLRNKNGGAAAFGHTKGFNFVEAKFLSLGELPEGAYLKLMTWRDNKMLSVDKLNLTPHQLLDFQPNYQNITRVDFKPSGTWEFIVKGIRIGVGEPQNSVVTDPILTPHGNLTLK